MLLAWYIHQIRNRLGEKGGRVVDADVPTPGDHDAAVDDHVGDVGGSGGEHDGLDGRAATRGADRLQVDGDEIGTRTDGQRPRVGPAECVLAVQGGRPEQSLGGDDAAFAAGQALVELGATSLLEQVDHRV